MRCAIIERLLRNVDAERANVGVLHRFLLVVWLAG